MEYLDSLLKKACERCEEHSTKGVCECMLSCPVYGLYVEAKNVGRRAYGFEIKKDFYKKAIGLIENCSQPVLF